MTKVWYAITSVIGVKQQSTSICGKDAMKTLGVYLRQSTEEWNPHRHLQRTTEKDRSLPRCWTKHPAFILLDVLLPLPSLFCWLGISLLLKKVNLPWNQLCPTETQQGVQTLGTENRGSCQGEKSHRMSVCDGTVGVCHYSLMAEHCRCCYESKMLPQHNCCFSSASEQKNKAESCTSCNEVYSEDLCVFTANNKTLFFIQMPHQPIILSKGWVHGSWKLCYFDNSCGC